MKTKIIDMNKIVSFISIAGEEDLKLNPIIYTDPPPVDETCDGCGRHVSELNPFGKAGDALVGDIERALLIKTFRRMGPMMKKLREPGISYKTLDAKTNDNNREKRKENKIL